jgi:hypothetical protein
MSVEQFTREYFRNKYFNSIPVIINKNNIPLSKYKFLISNLTTVSGLQFILREYILPNELNKYEACFLITEDGVMLSGNMLISQIERHHSNVDGFLHLNFQKENAFG